MTILKEFKNAKDMREYITKNKIKTCERREDRANKKIILIYEKKQ